MVLGMVFEDGLINGDIYIYPRLTPVATATKFGIKLAITRLVREISARFLRLKEFLGLGHRMMPIVFSPTDSINRHYCLIDYDQHFAAID